MRGRVIVLWLLLLVVGCSGGGGGSSSSAVINTTSATTGQPISIDLSRSTLSVNKTTAVANGSDQIVATLTARDSNGRPVAGFAFAVQVSGAENTLTQPAPTDSNGVTQALLVSTRAEGKSVTASLNGAPLGSAATVTFIPGPPAKLSLRVPPPAQVQLGAVMPDIRIAVEDLFGNLVTDLGTGSTTMTVTVSPHESQLSGTLSHDVVDGFAQFSGLSFGRLGSGRILTFKLRGIEASSAEIEVLSTPVATNQLAFVSSPSGTLTAADDNLGEVAVRLQNENRVHLTQSGVEITLAVSTGPGALEGTTTVNTDADGVATFTGLALKTAGIYKLTATSSSQDFPNSATSTEFVVVGDSSRPNLRFLTQPSGSVSIDSSLAVQVEAVDPFGNRLSSFGSAVHLSLQNTSSLPGGLALTPSAALDQTASQGVVDYSGLAVTGNFETTENGYFLRASSLSNGGLTVDSTQFSLVGGPAATLSFVTTSPAPTVQPADPFEGNAFALSVRVLDQHGNFSPTAVDTVSIALDDGQATPEGVRGMSTLAGTLSKPAVAGRVSFDDLTLSKTGSNFVLTASAPSLASDSTDPFTVSLSAGPRTLVVDNVNGKSAAEGGNGLPGCPFASIDQALAEAETDADVNIIEVVGTGVDYAGDVNLAAPGLSQSITLRGRPESQPTLTGQVTMDGQDQLRNLFIFREVVGEPVVGELSDGGGLYQVKILNYEGLGLRLSILDGLVTLSEVQVDGTSSAAEITTAAGADCRLDLCSFGAVSGSALKVSGGSLSGLNNNCYSDAGPAMEASNVSVSGTGLEFSTLSSKNSPSNGVNFSNVMGGPFVCGSLAVSGCRSSGVVVSGSNLELEVANCEVSSTVMASGSRAVDLSSHTGKWNCARMDCDVNQSGLYAGSGQLAVGPTGESKLKALNGPALTCQGTVFGTAGVRFASISSSSGVNGIYLADITGGPFTVQGTGTPGSGGTLKTISRSAVELVNCSNVTLNGMTIGEAGSLNNIVKNGVDGVSSGSVSLQNCSFLNVGGGFGAQGAVWAVSPSGPWEVLECRFERSYSEHIGIRNNSPSSTPPKILVRGSTFEDSNGGEAIFYNGNNGSSGEVEIKSCTFVDSETDHIRISSAAGANVLATIGGPVESDGNQFQTLTGSTKGRDGVTLDSRGSMTYLVQNNTANHAEVAFGATASGAGVMNGSFLSNKVGTDGVSASGAGFVCLSEGTSSLTFGATGNQVRRSLVGFQVEVRDNSVCSGNIVSNDLADLSDPTSNNGLVIYAGRPASSDTSTTCLDVRDNLLQSTLSSDLFYFVNAGCTLQLPDYVGPSTGPTAVTAVTAHFVARNPGLSQVTGTVDGTAAACP